MMILAEVRTRWMRARVRTRAFLDLGGRFIMEGSTGSTPRDWAGGPSMRMSGGVFLVEGLGRKGKYLMGGRLTDPQDLHGV